MMASPTSCGWFFRVDVKIGRFTDRAVKLMAWQTMQAAGFGRDGERGGASGFIPSGHRDVWLTDPGPA